MKKTALVGVALVSAGAIALYSQRGGKDAEPTDSSDYTVDRIWIDHIPRSERDTIQIFLAITEQPFGVFQATSQWKGQFELFRYEKHGDELRVYYGQSGEREKIKAKSVKCDEKGFDYCLELSGGSRGVKKYYSMEGWEIDGLSNLDVEHVRARLPSFPMTETAEDE